MKKFNPFRVSFDGPLGARERTRARVTATVVSSTAIFLGGTSLLALLNASSEAIGSWSNGKPATEARLVAPEGEDPSGKDCDDQTWPYFEARCLKRVESNATERSTPKHGLGPQEVILPAAPAAKPAIPAAEQEQQPKRAPEKETTGSVSRATPVETAPVPLPVSAPGIPTAAEREANFGSHETVGTAPRIDAEPVQAEIAEPKLSKRELRQLKRAERKRFQLQRREEARRSRADRRRARAMARAESRRGNGERIVRRWTEYTYASPGGGSRRVIVIRRGSPDDDFFSRR